MALRTRQIALLRPEEIIAEQRQCPLIYWPMGPIEWHGPHLPVGTDPLNAAYVAEQAAERTGGLVWPTAWWGTERERGPKLLADLGLPTDAYVVGMDFPANSLPSGYVPEEIFAILVRAQLDVFIHLGFKIVVLLSGHAATNQLEVLHRLAAEYNGSRSLKVLVEIPFIRGADGIMRVGHASRVETAVMQALHPESVKLEALPPLPQPLNNADWAVIDYATFAGDPTPDLTVHAEDDPRIANAAAGLENIHLALENIVQHVEAALGKNMA